MLWTAVGPSAMTGLLDQLTGAVNITKASHRAAPKRGDFSQGQWIDGYGMPKSWGEIVESVGGICAQASRSAGLFSPHEEVLS